MRVKARKHVRNEGSRRFKSAPLRQRVGRFSDLWRIDEIRAWARDLQSCMDPENALGSPNP